MGSCLLTSHHNQLINFKTAFTMSMEKPSFAWPLFACLCCWPIGIATCCQYSAVGTAVGTRSKLLKALSKRIKYENIFFIRFFDKVLNDNVSCRQPRCRPSRSEKDEVHRLLGVRHRSCLVDLDHYLVRFPRWRTQRSFFLIIIMYSIF